MFETARPADYLTRLAASDLGAAYKTIAIEELAIEAGAVIVDLGCGPGADLAALSDATGPHGAVLGLDHDLDAVAQARDRAAGRSNIAVRVADAHHLDLATAEVDRLHTDRVLQHVADPAQVLSEVVRVLRPGGRAVFAEPDWDTLVIDHPNVALAAAYRSFVVDKVVRNARIGRQLHRLAHSAGLHAARVLPLTTTFLDAAQADRVLGFERVTDRAIAAGYLDKTGAKEWLQHLQTAPFFASVSLFVTSCELETTSDAQPRRRTEPAPAGHVKSLPDQDRSPGSCPHGLDSLHVGYRAQGGVMVVPS
ncbi:MAG: methyltransferase domain-containing protein [Jatrophihabitans sp.]